MTAFRAAALLVRDRDGAVALLKERLRATANVDSAAVAKLAGQLDSPQFAVRDKAAHELEKLGPEVAGDLRKALEAATSAEARDKLKALLERCAAQGRQGLRAVAVLDRIGTPVTRALLAELAAGGDSPLTRAAANPRP